MRLQPGSPFRLHLITAVALMFLAGWIVKLNATFTYANIGGYGWPFPFYLPRSGPSMWDCIHTRRFLIDLATAGIALLLTAGAMEGWLRRREVLDEYRGLCRAAECGRYRWFQLRPLSMLLALMLTIGIYVTNEQGFSRGWPIPFRLCTGSCWEYDPGLEAWNIVVNFTIFAPFIAIYEYYARARDRALIRAARLKVEADIRTAHAAGVLREQPTLR